MAGAFSFIYEAERLLFCALFLGEEKCGKQNQGQIWRKPMMEDLIKEESKPLVPVCEKYTLTIREAAAYFNIGIKKMRRLAEENTGRFSVFSGNKYLIIRKKFEKFIDDSSEI